MIISFREDSDMICVCLKCYSREANSNKVFNCNRRSNYSADFSLLDKIKLMFYIRLATSRPHFREGERERLLERLVLHQGAEKIVCMYLDKLISGYYPLIKEK